MNAEIELCGERLVLRADRSVHWPRRRTLMIADPHVGKSDTFRAAGLPVPGNADRMLSRIASALEETAAEQLIVLGDFWHDRSGRTDQLINDLTNWREEHGKVSIEMIRGNHDRAGPPPKSWAEAWQREAVIDAPFVFSHVPAPSSDGYVMAGHLHPGVALSGPGRQRLRLPCFWFRPAVGVLPAFGDFTGLANVTALSGDRVFAIADGHVINVTASRVTSYDGSGT